MGKKSLGYVVLAALILALAFGAHSGTALQPPPAGGPGPGTLPDILGITTGMPAQQALDLLRAHDPGHTAAYVRWTIPQLYGNRPIMSSMNTADTGTEVFDVRLTIPPLEQRVYRVERVLHVTAPRAALVNELLEARQKLELRRVLARWERYDLIAIDEVGYVPMAEVGAEFLFQVIAERAEKSAVILTTNLPFSEWTQVIPNARLCKALLDRITDRAHIIETGTESYRFRRTVERSRSKTSG